MDISLHDIDAKPALPPTVRSSAGLGWLSRWHLLSLDAPCVATSWTWLVCRATHTTTTPARLLAMFLAVWLIYAGDRLLDAAGNSTDTLEARHLFHHVHRLAFRSAMLAAAAMLTPLVFAIPATLLQLYIALAALLAVWFGMIHLAPPGFRSKLPKELVPGTFCASAAFIPVWAARGFWHADLACAALAYAALCSLNCWYIYSCEHEDLAEASLSTRLGVRWLNYVGVALIVLTLLAASFGSRELAPVFAAVSLGSGLLLGLPRIDRQVQPTDLRAASDLVLLTPLLIAPFLR